MTLKLFLILLTFSFVCQGQTLISDDFKEINYTDVMEINDLIYFRTDTTLVSGKVIRYNRKNEAKKYILVSNGKPDSFGWIQIEEKYQEPEKKLKAKNTVDVVNEAGITVGSIEMPSLKYDDQMSDRNDIAKNIQSNIDASILTKLRNSSYEDEVLKNNSVNDEVDKNGILEKYYSNGKLESKGVYIDGKKDGLWEEYFDNGQLKSKGNYIKGKKDGFWQEYYNNGHLESKVNFADDKKVGLFERYHFDGKLLSRINYKDGKENGIIEVYHNNGQLMMKGLFKDAKEIGEWKYYNENGELTNRENFGN